MSAIRVQPTHILMYKQAQQHGCIPTGPHNATSAHSMRKKQVGGWGECMYACVWISKNKSFLSGNKDEWCSYVSKGIGFELSTSVQGCPELLFS